ncbi:hypothetical protein B7463_g7748, partial [Scytalidium lignicola]
MAVPHQEAFGDRSELPARQSAGLYIYLISPTDGFPKFGLVRNSISSRPIPGVSEAYSDGPGFALHVLYSTYSTFVSDFIDSSANLLKSLSEEPAAQKFYPRGFDIIQWLQEPSTRPDDSYLALTPVSFSLDGLIQLANYASICKGLGMTPGQFRDSLCGTTGGSQGVIVAVVVAASSSWETFERLSKEALTIIFWLGVRSQESYPVTSLVPYLVEESIENGEGIPTPMLRVRGLSYSELREHVDAINSQLSEQDFLDISTKYGVYDHVVSGSPTTLYGLNLQLRTIKAKGPWQSRPAILKFLPCTVPLNSRHLLDVGKKLKNDLNYIEILGNDLKISVYDMSTGRDLCRLGHQSVIPTVIEAITYRMIELDQALMFAGTTTHILDFGSTVVRPSNPVLVSGEGTGVSLIYTLLLEAENTDVGYRGQLFRHQDQTLSRFLTNWAVDFRPQVMTTCDGRSFLGTKLSRTLGVPPLLISGGSPSANHWDFVAAMMNAGYYAELSGNAYYEPEPMATALLNLANAADPGRGITFCFSERSGAMWWQLPVIMKLGNIGICIHGLSFGSSLTPTVDLVNQCIGGGFLKYLTFSVNSTKSLKEILCIAETVREFPIIIFWVGDQSCYEGDCTLEQVYAPILQNYAWIRNLKNVFLVIGLESGKVKDVFRYITGEWAQKLGHPAMPFDGCSFSTRVMTAKNAHTHIEAKRLICGKGSDALEQEAVTLQPTNCRVITVRDIEGRAINMIRTRGSELWSELDQNFFILEVSKRNSEFKKNRKYLMQRLQDDFQKVWFGVSSVGTIVELADMTYADVVSRMVDLMFIRTRNCWIDESFRDLTFAFIRRLEERLVGSKLKVVSVAQCPADLNHPYQLCERLWDAYPSSSNQLLTFADEQYFVALCQRKDQRAVPFIVGIDEDFEYWFKSDFMWYCEDLDAVIDQDIGRTCIQSNACIIGGTRFMEMSVKDILDDASRDLVMRLGEFDVGRRTISVSRKPSTSVHSIAIAQDADSISYHIPSTKALPDRDSWYRLLADSGNSWCSALFTSNSVLQGHISVSNQLRQIFAPVELISVKITHPEDPNMTTITINNQISSKRLGKCLTQARFELRNENEICLQLTAQLDPSSPTAILELKFIYHPDMPLAPIHEVLDHRVDSIKLFCYRLWFGGEDLPSSDSITDCFSTGDVTPLTKEALADFLHLSSHINSGSISLSSNENNVPIDFALAVAGKAMVKALFLPPIDGDFFTLSILSTEFRIFDGVDPLQVGHLVKTTVQIMAITNETFGKVVHVCAHIFRNDVKVMEVSMEFVFRGVYSDFQNTFQQEFEPPMYLELATAKDVAVFLSKTWFRLDLDLPLIGRKLIFKLQTLTDFWSKSQFRGIKTTGEVLLNYPSDTQLRIGTVLYEARETLGNPVTDYLRRNGSPLRQPYMFKEAISIDIDESFCLQLDNSHHEGVPILGDAKHFHFPGAISTFTEDNEAIDVRLHLVICIRNLIDNWVTENKFQSMMSLHNTFIGNILPTDKFDVKLHHLGMVEGRKIISARVFKLGTAELLLQGEAEVEQPRTSYIFTGQGSQVQGMGMELYAKSEASRAVWDRADKHLLATYGFAITDIIRKNPKRLSIYFNGAQGNRVRQSYVALEYEATSPNGYCRIKKIFEDINDGTVSYTFTSPSGLLSLTHFAQLALTLSAMATVADMRSKGLIQKGSTYSGHSLGEFSALMALNDFMSVEAMASFVFCRGLTTHVAVDRDNNGLSNYTMCAVDPSRIGISYNEEGLQFLIQTISEVTNWTLEIVNFNVQDRQYVCSGDRRAIFCLIQLTDWLKGQRTNGQDILPTSPSRSRYRQLIVDNVKKSAERAQASTMIELKRGVATLPLKGIDVPFHSSILLPGVAPFRKYLQQNIAKSSINASNLVGKFIPNITAKPFAISRECLEDVFCITGSQVLKHVLANVTNEAVKADKSATKVLEAVQKLNPDVSLDFQHHLVGGSSLDATGEAITTEALTAAKEADAVLLGAVGGPVSCPSQPDKQAAFNQDHVNSDIDWCQKWDSERPRAVYALSILRKALGTFGNLRPVTFAAPSLVNSSSLKASVCSGVDFTIIRELAGGIYYGERTEPNAHFDLARDVEIYERFEVERVTRLAGTLAMQHDPPLTVTSLDKANLLAAAGRLWRGVVSEVMAKEFPTVPLRHLFIDTAAMQMVRNPRNLNGIILTSNLFGDIISDEASVIPGSIGLLPSASLSAIPQPGVQGSKVRGLYEPIHGSAPDIYGQSIANPTGAILSAAMMLRYSLNMPVEAAAIEEAVQTTIESGIRTPDIGGSASTREFGDAVVKVIEDKSRNSDSAVSEK